MAKAKDLERKVKQESLDSDIDSDLVNSQGNPEEEEDITRESGVEGKASDDTSEESAAGENSEDDWEDEPEGEEPSKAGKPDKAQTKIDELNDRLMRQMAEFDNFRKRSEKEKTQMFETGARSVLEKILPVVDNFERGLAAVSPENEKDPFAEGMQMVYRQLMQELENLEVKPIEAVGKEFDPEYHNAVMQAQSEEYESGIVTQELQKGYMYRTTVLRHSMVAVAE